MKENTLLKISFVCSLLGITILFFSMQYSELDLESDISKDTFEDNRITGTIDRITKTNTTTFISLKQETKIDAIAFKSPNLVLEKGDLIEIYGQIGEKGRETTIIIDELRLLR